MSGEHDPKDFPGEEPSGGSIPTDPALEAALREAAEAIPDRPEKARRKRVPVAEPESAAHSDAEREPGAAEDESRDLEHLLDDEIEAGLPPEVAFALRDELAEANGRLLRLQADFDNFRKRALKERQEALQYGSQNLFKDLLPVVDNLDRAIEHARENTGGDLETFLQGVELVRRELIAVFGKHHVTEIEALGKPFNPALHEAMAQVEDDSVSPNTVVEVLQKGYELRDRLVRPARVVVAKAAAAGKPAKE